MALVQVLVVLLEVILFLVGYLQVVAEMVVAVVSVHLQELMVPQVAVDITDKQAVLEVRARWDKLLVLLALTVVAQVEMVTVLAVAVALQVVAVELVETVYQVLGVVQETLVAQAV